MWLTATLMLGAGLVVGPFDDYSRSFDREAITPDTLASERYGKENALALEPEGLRIRLEPGDEETGWRSPTTLRIGGNATIHVEVELGSLPTPEQIDGVAVGISVATQNLDQPDATLVRLTEPDGSPRYRVVNQPKNVPRQTANMRMMAQPNIPGAGNPQPPRPTFPAEGASFRLVLQREGSTLHYRAVDDASNSPRSLGQMTIGTGDLIGLKVFALNRNGTDDVDVVLKSVHLHADQLSGLGTAIRTIDSQVVYGDPIGLEENALLIGPSHPSQTASTSESAPPDQGIQTFKGGRVIPEGRLIVRENVVVGGEGPVVVEGVLNGTIAAAPESPPPFPLPNREEPPPPSPSPANADSTPPRPKATLALDEIDLIRFERPVTLSARFLGQPNVDVTCPHPSTEPTDERPTQVNGATDAAPKADQPAPPPGTVVPITSPTTSVVRPSQGPRVEPEPNGIRDLHLSVSGLRPVELTQIVVSCQTDEGQTQWRLNTSGSTDWPLALRRSGNRPQAELFLEPPPGDCNGKTFHINLSYADQQSVSLSIEADQPTDPGLAIDAEQPASSSGFAVRVFLADGQELSGVLDAMNEESITLTPDWPEHDAIEIPLSRIRGVRVESPDQPESSETFSERLNAPGTEDVLLARTRGGELVPVSGILEGLEGDRIRMLYQNQSRTVPLRQVEGIVFAEGPQPGDLAPDEPLASLVMSNDQTISGFWRAIDGSSWTIETIWGASLKVPAAEVRSVRFRSPRMTYLSDLTPSQVEQIPYFGRLIPWKRDTSLSGGPLRIDGQTIDRGVAVHSYCELTYDLNGRFDTFEALVGFDDEANARGRVDCRVFADDTELFANPDLRADAPPTPLRLSVAGAQTLRLVVDYGPGQDTGDRLIWANARLLRDSPAQP